MSADESDRTMQIRTERLLLRPLSLADADGYGRLLADPAVHPFVVESGPVPQERIPDRIARKQQEWADGTAATRAVLRDEECIGYVALHDLGKPRVAMNYAMAPDHQRRGHAAEAVAAVLGRAAELGCGDVEARTHPDNEASARLLSRAGFIEMEPETDPARRVFVWTSTPLG